MALTASELLTKVWNDYVQEKANHMQAVTEIGVDAKLVGEVYMRIIAVKDAMLHMSESLDRIERVLEGWQKSGELTGRMAASQARKMCGIKREDQSEN
jgi:hypothetical protein